jgi:hypothetical protein
MKAVDSAVGQVRGVVVGSWSDGCCQYKAVVDIDRGVFFEPMLFFLSRKSLISELLIGRLAERTNLASTAMPSLMLIPSLEN